MDPYLEATELIDWHTPSIASLATTLRGDESDPASIAGRCFEFVRDDIKHSQDHGLSVVTLRASDVLRARSGFCYAKSHLLAALLRANGVPTGFCYQRLSCDDTGSRYCLHGLNAILLPDIGWYRVDARGNRHDIDCQFDPPLERLAFRPTDPGEADLPEIWPAPLPMVVEALSSYSTAESLGQNLPDVTLWTEPRTIKAP